jgi:ribonuclease VapC
MLIDTSAIVAILLDEPGQRRYDEAIEAAEVRLVSAVTRSSFRLSSRGRKGAAGRERLERFFHLTGADIIAVTSQQAEIAIEAFPRFG